MENTPHLSIAELATRFGVSDRTLERWRHEGIGPRFLKFNAHIQYRKSDVEDYEGQCLRISTSERALAGGVQ